MPSLFSRSALFSAFLIAYETLGYGYAANVYESFAYIP